MKNKRIIFALLCLVIPVSMLNAAEIVPYLAKTGIGGVDVKAYAITDTKNNIIMTNKVPSGLLPGDVGSFIEETSTFNYTTTGYMLKASVRPPLLGLELTGRIGTVGSKYEKLDSTSTQTYSEGTRNGLTLGVGLKKSIIGEVGLLPQVVLGVEGAFTHTTNDIAQAAGYKGSSYDIEVQGSILASKEFMIRIKKPSKQETPVTLTGLVEPEPEPVIKPEELAVPLCFMDPIGDQISDSELNLITEYSRKGLSLSGKFKLIDKETLKKTLEKIGLKGKSCADVGCAKNAAKELKMQHVMISRVTKSEDGSYIYVLSLIDADAAVLSKIEPEGKQEKDINEGEPGENATEEKLEEPAEVEQSTSTEKGKIIYTDIITFDNIETAEEAVKTMIDKFINSAGSIIYDARKVQLISQKKKQMKEEAKLKEAKDLQKKIEKKLKQDEKNAFKVIFVPYAGLKYNSSLFIRKDTAKLVIPLVGTYDEWFYGIKTCKAAGVAGLQFKFMNFISFFVEGGFSGETLLSGGLSISFGL